MPTDLEARERRELRLGVAGAVLAFLALTTVQAVAALGLDGLPGARLGLWTAAVTLAQLALTGVAWAGFVTASRGRRPSDPAPGVPQPPPAAPRVSSRA